MENVLGVEEARRLLGELVYHINQGKEPVIITRQAKEKAVLMSYEEYKKLQDLAVEAAANRVAQALKKIHQQVNEAGIPPTVVEEAIREVRSR